MKITVDINIENARKTLCVSAGNIEEETTYLNMTDMEIKDKIISRCRCWGLTEVKGDD